MNPKTSHLMDPIDDEVAMGRGLLIHVGYPKTASTWLQQNLFDNGAAGFLSPWSRRAGVAIDHFVLRNGFAFDPDEVRREMAPGLVDAAKAGRTAVLSEETLIGDICAGKYWGPEVLRRLHATFPLARVLICIREQKSMIYSAYGQYIRAGGVQAVERFTSPRHFASGVGPLCRPDALLYHLPVRAVQDRFGPAATLALPMELLGTQPEVFLGRLCTFAGARGDADAASPPTHVGWGAATLAVARRLNRLWVRDSPRDRRIRPLMLRAFDKGVPRRIHRRFEARLRDAIERTVTGCFAHSNRETSELIGIDLSRLGYET